MTEELKPELPALPPPPAEVNPVQELADQLLKVLGDVNPSFETTFAALSNIVVALSLQYLYVGLGEITEEGLAEQLTRFQGYTSELAIMKMQKLNEDIARMKMLETYAEVIKQRTGEG